MSQPKITRMVAGKEVEVPIEEVWDSICKILRLARLVTYPGENGTKHRDTRLAFMSERLNDIENMEFHYRRNAYSSNMKEMFLIGD